MEANRKSINDIFNGNRILEIPYFQRSYVWDIPQWERLLEDMETISSKNTPFFLGSIILKQQLTPSESSIDDVRTVIDGQQRLTTLNIFFKVLSLLSDNSYLSSLFRLPLKANEIALKHNHNDIRIFEQIMNLNTLDVISENSNIARAYTFFTQNINLERLNFQNILTNAMFVGIDLGIDEDEQQIFDTINSLGVRLTTAELLKNYFFNRDIDSYNKYWKEIFEKDDEAKNYWDSQITTGRVKRTIIDLFFYSYLQIKIQEEQFKVKTEDKIEFSRVDSLFESYKKFIKVYKIDKSVILSEIKEYATIFRSNFDYLIVEKALTNNFGIERINTLIFGLDNSTLIPYILYILKNQSDINQQNLIFEYLESYIMRRMVVHLTTKNYNQLFTDRLIFKRILTKEQLEKYIIDQEDKINYFPKDDELELGFSNTILINKQALGILYFIETKYHNDKDSTALLGINKYSLEHLMPKKWENNWGKIEEEQQKNERNKRLQTLGNLTIITQSLNASIRDAGWQDKVNGKNEKGGLKKYSSGIKIIANYLDLQEWNEEQIKNRAIDLCNKAKEIWK